VHQPRDAVDIDPVEVSGGYPAYGAGAVHDDRHAFYKPPETLGIV
jgi:hypothetical protein